MLHFSIQEFHLSSFVVKSFLVSDPVTSPVICISSVEKENIFFLTYLSELKFLPASSTCGLYVDLVLLTVSSSLTVNCVVFFFLCSTLVVQLGVVDDTL